MSDLSTGPSTLVIDFGDLPSLVCGFLESDPTRAVLWHRRGAGVAGARRVALLEENAVALGVERTVFTDPLPAAFAERPELVEAIDLLEACTAAESLGCHRVVWPLVCGPDPTLLANAVERSCLAALLAASTPDVPRVVVEIPVADLADAAIADLAEDLNIPPRLFWPCTSDAAGRTSPCGTCQECRRWRGAFSEARVEWPWAGAPAAVTV
ncbi:MAG: 7-cyano-7-deazaguanine synthase [Phycisphaerales bacterium]|nr:7-cyano-7-deazaguanine synthase [Phycisphaerales bacterium]